MEYREGLLGLVMQAVLSFRKEKHQKRNGNKNEQN
jgi:hypothetical protein